MHKLPLIPLLLAIAGGLSAQDAVLVKDVQTGTGSSNPGYVTAAADGTLIFAAAPTGSTYGLYRTDGSAAGTAAINLAGARIPGSASFPDLETFATGTQTFFLAGDSVTGAELWKLNGSIASAVTDLQPGVDSGFLASGTGLGGAPLQASGTNGNMIFVGRNLGPLLTYYTTGTEASISLVGSGSAPKIGGLSNTGISTYFTSTGTWQLNHSAPLDGSFPSTNPLQVSTTLTTATAIQSYLQTADLSKAIALRDTDVWGVVGSNVTLLHTAPSGRHVLYTAAGEIAGKLYFVTAPINTTASGVCELYETDGATATLKTSYTLPLATYTAFELTAGGSNLYFFAIKADLTTEFYSGSITSITAQKTFSGYPSNAGHLGNASVFLINSLSTATDIGVWTANSGGVLPARLGAYSGLKSNLAFTATKMAYVADDGTGYAVYLTDGTIANTVKIGGGYSMTASSGDFLSMPGTGSALYFAATSAAAGKELWSTSTTISLPVVLTAPTITGPAAPTVGVSSLYQISTVTGATGYQYRVDGGAPANANADGSYGYIPATAGAHLLEARAVSASGAGPFGAGLTVTSVAAVVGGGGTGGGSGGAVTPPPADNGGGGGGGGCGLGSSLGLMILVGLGFALRSLKSLKKEN